MHEDRISAIVGSIESLQTSGSPLVANLRSLYPDVAFICCQASDMEGTPYLENERFSLFLIDRSEMCIRLTDRLESADGLVIATP